MCSCEWPGRLKCLATDLDRSDPLFLVLSLVNPVVVECGYEKRNTPLVNTPLVNSVVVECGYGERNTPLVNPVVVECGYGE